MASIAVLVIVLGCAAAQYFKGSLITAATTAIAAVSAAFAAMGFYEWLAGILGRYTGALAAWGDMIAFVVLFILVFALLQTAIAQLLHEPINLGHWPEQIGRPLCGAVLGWVVAGVLLTAAALAPLPLGYPYPRFEERRPDPDKPSRVLLNADGFVTGWFGLVSRGSLQALQGHQSFATVHAGFLDQLYLNRLGIGDKVPLRIETGTEAIEVPRRAAVWEAPEGVTDTEGRPLPAKPGADSEPGPDRFQEHRPARRQPLHALPTPPGVQTQGSRQTSLGRQGPGRVPGRLHAAGPAVGGQGPGPADHGGDPGLRQGRVCALDRLWLLCAQRLGSGAGSIQAQQHGRGPCAGGGGQGPAGHPL